MEELPKFTAAEITAALNNKSRKNKGRENKSRYYVRDVNGQLVLIYEKPNSEQVGSFFGRQGIMRKYNDTEAVAIAYSIKR